MFIKARQIKSEVEKELLYYNTSFFGGSLTTTVNSLRKKFGKETENWNGGGYETNFDWFMMLEISPKVYLPFTIYDYQLYRKLKLSEDNNFHIGARTPAESEIIKYYLSKVFDKDFSEKGYQLETDTFYNSFKTLFENWINESERFEERVKNGEKLYIRYFLSSNLLKEELKNSIV